MYMSKLLNDIQLPKPIFDAMTLDKYEGAHVDISPSSIVYGAKEYWGRKRNPGLKSVASKRWGSFTGTLMHEGLKYLLSKYAGPGEYELERRIEFSFNEKARVRKLEIDLIIGGGIDGIYKTAEGKRVLFDYKTMASVQFIDEEKITEWTIKANLYKYIYEKATGEKIHKLVYIALYKDWTATKAQRSRQVDDVPCKSVVLDVWPEDKIETFIYERALYFEQYRFVDYKDVPYCTDKERWMKPQVFKVGKITNGKVERAYPKCTFETIEEANTELDKRNSNGIVAGIKVDGGESTKCEKGWCPLSANNVCDYCKQQGV